MISVENCIITSLEVCYLCFMFVGSQGLKIFIVLARLPTCKTLYVQIHSTLAVMQWHCKVQRLIKFVHQTKSGYMALSLGHDGLFSSILLRPHWAVASWKGICVALSPQRVSHSVSEWSDSPHHFIAFRKKLGEQIKGKSQMASNTRLNKQLFYYIVVMVHNILLREANNLTTLKLSWWSYWFCYFLSIIPLLLILTKFFHSSGDMYKLKVWGN